MSTTYDRAPAASVSLGDQSPGFRGRILAHKNGGVALRLRELGFVAGTAVSVLRRGPLGGPFEVELRGYRICLRRNDIAAIDVEPLMS
ncbi:MAG: ferrous iron transport protein A [Acidobacteria bacterium]|nr:MAG: ferrous iron transport protein A [Acidobacteriota bacterium]